MANIVVSEKNKDALTQKKKEDTSQRHENICQILKISIHVFKL